MDFHSIRFFLFGMSEMLGTLIFTSYIQCKHKAESFSPFAIRTKRMHITSGKGRQIFLETRVKGKSKVL